MNVRNGKSEKDRTKERMGERARERIKGKALLIKLTLMITLMIPYPGTMIAEASSTAKGNADYSNTSVNLISVPDQPDTIPQLTNISQLTDAPQLTVTPQLTDAPQLTVTPQLTDVPQLTTTPQLTDVPQPTASPQPTMQPDTPDASITPTPTPAPATTPTITPTVEPAVTPLPGVRPYRSNTLNLMAGYDYINNSITGISQGKVSRYLLQLGLMNVGTLRGNGMPYGEYKKAMGYMWSDATEYGKAPVNMRIDINKTMDYKAYTTILKQLSRYEGVYLYKIGTSPEGRALYAVEIDMDSDYNKNVIMLTGQVHAREFGGGTFLVKQLVDLVQKAQTDAKTMELLKRNKYVAVPVINVDGREALIKTPGKYTTKGGILWKAYPNGTDGGRNFPGLQWGQIIKGSRLRPSIASKPGYANYPGTYAGSMNETKALMKWLYHYIVVEKADIYIDMHNQGSIIYAGKTWQTKAQARKSSDLRTGVMKVLNQGITKRKYTPVYESTLYGMRGEGSSLTDYAIGLAIGARFSPAYGFSAFTDGKKEYILMQVKDLDQTKLKISAPNPDFAAITLEIGYGANCLGNSSKARTLLANEYNYYNYGKLLEALPKLIG